MDLEDRIARHLRELSEAILLVDQPSIMEIVQYLQIIKTKRGTVWIIGNGGSAATASHFANDLRKMATLPAIALTDLTCTVTAYGNDNGWRNMFSHPLHFFLKPNDCLVAISCSGKSQNVIEAATQAGKDRLVILTGMPDKSNILANIPSTGLVYAHNPDIKIQEDIHLSICHAIASALAGER